MTPATPTLSVHAHTSLPLLCTLSCSYWCSEHPSGGGATRFEVPSGLTYTPDLLPHTPYKNGAEGAVMDVWRPAHWANWYATCPGVGWGTVVGDD